MSMDFAEAIQVAITVLRVTLDAVDQKGVPVAKETRGKLEEAATKLSVMLAEAQADALIRNTTHEEFVEYGSVYEKRMLAAGLDPAALRRRVEEAIRNGDMQAARDTFAHIRETIIAFENKKED